MMWVERMISTVMSVQASANVDLMLLAETAAGTYTVIAF